MEKTLFEASMRRMDWLRKNYGRLKKEFDNKWIIVRDDEVVGSGETFDEILPITKKFEPNSITVRYIQAREVAMFF